jgi:putative transcriptional regulator
MMDRVAESLAGKLLVASPLLDDPNFNRTVVLLCAHSDGGAFGLVLNRPSFVEVGDHLPQWLELLAAPSLLFNGGPVEPASAFGLASARSDVPEDGWMPVTERLGLLDLGQDIGRLATRVKAVRIFAGYAGWSAGQIESEIEAEGWFVVESDPRDLFSSDPEGLWRTVLRRQAGKLAMFAFFPSDPAAN